MKKICFVCTGNACRSQIAEGFAKKFGNGNIQVFSAGSHPFGAILPKAIEVMKEVGIDISQQKSKSINEIPLQEMDVVITLCGNADLYCPSPIQGGQKLHWPFEDPFTVRGSEEKVLENFRKVRDAIGEKIKDWLKTI